MLNHGSLLVALASFFDDELVLLEASAAARALLPLQLFGLFSLFGRVALIHSWFKTKQVVSYLSQLLNRFAERFVSEI